MKKSILIFAIACLLTAIPASAQFDFGIKAGLNYTEKPTDIKGIEKGHTGWHAGPMVKYIFPIVGLGVEANALYSRSGMNINNETYNKNSIEIPLYLRYELSIPGVNKVAIPFIAAGPQWGFAVGKKEYGENTAGTDNTQSKPYVKFNESNFSLNVGLGVILINHLQIHANYNIALGQTSEYFGGEFDWSGSIEAIKTKSRIWQLSVAYIF